MASMSIEINEYLDWMAVHNYAATTVENRRRYLGYFESFAGSMGVERPGEVSYELALGYQESLHAHRKTNGAPLSVATQVQRLVPLTQFFRWLRREGRIPANPVADLLMPRPNRTLPESTLSAEEFARLMTVPNVATPLGLRDRAILEVFYSSALRRNELISLRLHDVDFERGTVFVHQGKGSKDRYVPAGERALFGFGCISAWCGHAGSLNARVIACSSPRRGLRSARTGSVERCGPSLPQRRSPSGAVVTSCVTAWPP